MSYPDYPDNRLIVNGVDLYERFGIILLDGYTLTPPSPKTYTVDIPGGNGKLDLTESLLGDTAYNDREQEFSFAIFNAVQVDNTSSKSTEIDISKFETLKTDLSNFLHGKSFDYIMTMDPGYIYHGRFAVSEYSHTAYANGLLGTIKIKVVSKPFKTRNVQVYSVDAIGGRTVYLTSGRMRVRPTIETNDFIKVIHKNKLITLPQGSWVINDILFEEGTNEIYFNTYDIRNLRWGEVKSNGVTWGDFKARKLYEWYKSNGDGTYVIKTWAKLIEKTWGDLTSEKWVDQSYLKEIDANVKPVYIKYDWGDL